VPLIGTPKIAMFGKGRLN